MPVEAQLFAKRGYQSVIPSSGLATDEKREKFSSLYLKKGSCFLSINTLIKFPPVLSGVLNSLCCILASASEDVENVMTLRHLPRNRTSLGSGSLRLCCAQDGQGQPCSTADFGDVMENSEPSYCPLPSSSLFLGKPLPVRQNLPEISLTINGLGKLLHLVDVAGCSHIKT